MVSVSTEAYGKNVCRATSVVPNTIWWVAGNRVVLGMLSELWGVCGKKSQSEGGLPEADGRAEAGVLWVGLCLDKPIMALPVAMLPSQYRGVSGVGQLGAVVLPNCYDLTLSKGNAV